MFFDMTRERVRIGGGTCSTKCHPSINISSLLLKIPNSVRCGYVLKAVIWYCTSKEHNMVTVSDIKTPQLTQHDTITI